MLKTSRGNGTLKTNGTDVVESHRTDNLAKQRLSVQTPLQVISSKGSFRALAIGAEYAFKHKLRVTGLTPDQLQNVVDMANAQRAKVSIRPPTIAERLLGYKQDEVVVVAFLPRYGNAEAFKVALNTDDSFGPAIKAMGKRLDTHEPVVSIAPAIRAFAASSTAPVLVNVTGRSEGNDFAGTAWTMPANGTAGLELRARAPLNAADSTTLQQVALDSGVRLELSNAQVKVSSTGVTFEANSSQIEAFLSGFKARFGDGSVEDLNGGASRLTALVEQLRARNTDGAEDHVLEALTRLLGKAHQTTEPTGGGFLSQREFTAQSISATYVPSLLTRYLELTPDQLTKVQGGRTARHALLDALRDYDRTLDAVVGMSATARADEQLNGFAMELEFARQVTSPYQGDVIDLSAR